MAAQQHAGEQRQWHDQAQVHHLNGQRGVAGQPVGRLAGEQRRADAVQPGQLQEAADEEQEDGGLARGSRPSGNGGSSRVAITRCIGWGWFSTRSRSASCTAALSTAW